MDLSVTFIGTAASVPTAARGVAATLVARGGERWLVDCGEGTQRQLLRAGIGLVDVDLILLTHMHADHVLGLPGLLKTYGLRGRDRPLHLVGPAGLDRLMEVLRPVVGRLPFDVVLEEIERGDSDPAWEGDGYRIDPVPTRHSVASLGYALVEAERPGSFDVAAATALGVAPGPDFGVLQRGGEVTAAGGRTVRPADVLGPPRAGRTVVITGDTEPCDAVLEASRGAALLVHEATFLHADRDRARETRHTTAREAAELAREADVALLALTHLSSRYAPRDLRAEATAAFARTVVPRDFDAVEVPLPERGPPVLHPARDRARPPAPEAQVAAAPAGGAEEAVEGT
ncbi:ribonuclease Z [Miltoncostaea marina]|uniref:ribonuclease Z n=1 Tax=Miltoncostaea marina TaxID=2843215 RepID=UPI001C3D6F71|nr:ribonuclease Z [Miltoncostaea marina]